MVGVLQHFSVSPRPLEFWLFGLELKGLELKGFGLRVWGQGLTILQYFMTTFISTFHDRFTL